MERGLLAEPPSDHGAQLKFCEGQADELRARLLDISAPGHPDATDIPLLKDTRWSALL